MKLPVTAVFDIGKTNKKFLLFDSHFNEVHRKYITLPEIQDDDGFPCENLPLLTEWMQDTLQKAVQSVDYQVEKLNFSTYGASFVHLDGQGNAVIPLYNYTKPFPEPLWDVFSQIVGSKDDFCVQTASPALGMLNSGLQLFWLQQQKPHLFQQIRHSLHLPQYCSYLFTKQLHSDYTSIGCHTGLWDFTKNDYHDWVKTRGIQSLLPPIVPAMHRTRTVVFGQAIEVGTGIHDSSAALLPYLFSTHEPFLLLSTGTWNIAFNPFSQNALTLSELNQDCLNYMRTDGSPVKASRLFFGNEFNLQTKHIAERFNRTDGNYQHTIIFDEQLYQKWKAQERLFFHWESIQYPDQSIVSAPETHWNAFDTIEDAFHCLMVELMRWQKHAIQLAIGSTPIRKIFVDGGFSQSDAFINLLLRELPDYEIIVSSSPLGSSLGAAMLMHEKEVIQQYQFEQRRVSVKLA